MNTDRSIQALVVLLALSLPLPGCNTNQSTTTAAPLDASNTARRSKLHQPPPAPSAAPTAPTS